MGKIKPIYLVGGLGLVIGIVGYAWWKNGQASAGDTTGATDATAEPSQDSYIPPYSAYNTTGGVDLSQLPPLDNPAWSQRVQDLLTGIGFDPAFISTTIGKYLGRQPLTSAESDLVRNAIAMVGLPPVGQFPLIPVSTPTPTPTPTPKPTPGPTPGLPAKVTGLHVHSRTSKTINLSWDHASKALGYALYRNGKAINYPLHNYATVGSIHATYTVKARNAKGYGPASNPLTV